MAVFPPGEPAGSSAYRSGLALVEAGRFAEAERRLKRALLLHPDDPEICLAVGIAVLNQERPDEAVGFLAKTASVLPDRADARYLHGLALVRLHRLAEAEVELAAALTLDAHLDKAWFHRGGCLWRLGRITDLLGLAAARHDHRNDGADFLFEVVMPSIDAGDYDRLGGLAAAAGRDHPAAAVVDFLAATGHAAAARWAPAHQLYRAAADAAPPGFFGDRMLPPCRLLAPAEWNPAAVAKIELPPISDLDPAAGDGPVVLVAADARYIELFLQMFAHSLAAAAPGARCHIHVVDPDDRSTAAIADLRRLGGLSIGISSEQSGDARGAGYYAAARFLRAEALMDCYAADLILTDIDATVLRDPRLLTAMVGDAAAGCFYPRFPTAVFPWLGCSAALVAVRDSSAGRAFLDGVSRYIGAHLVHGRGWFIDQIALHFVGRVRSPGMLIDLQQASGGAHEDFCRPEGMLEVKQRLRAAADA
jgi:tetratricopeptide (TPR) repeat protein